MKGIVNPTEEKEKEADTENEPCCTSFLSVFDLSNLKHSFSSALKKREGHQRKVVILVTLVYAGHGLLFGVDKLTNQVTIDKELYFFITISFISM